MELDCDGMKAVKQKIQDSKEAEESEITVREKMQLWYLWKYRKDSKATEAL